MEGVRSGNQGLPAVHLEGSVRSCTASLRVHARRAWCRPLRESYGFSGRSPDLQPGLPMPPLARLFLRLLRN